VWVTPADFQSIEACHLFHCTCPCLATTRIVDTEKLLEYVLPFNDPEALVA
jgi:hypothetical protein